MTSTPLFDESSPSSTVYSPTLQYKDVLSDDEFELLPPWEKICRKLKTLLSKSEFDHWIAPIKIRHTDDHNELVLLFSDAQTYQHVIDMYLDKFDFCKMCLGLSILLRFEVSGELTSEHGGLDFKDPMDAVLSPFTIDIQPSYTDKNLPSPPQEAYTPPTDDFGNDPKMAAINLSVSRTLSTVSYLNPEYRFDNFVNGPSNQFAHASCLAVADAPGKTYNPLFLYGSTGLGKTHLLHAVGNAALSQNKNLVVTYISSERFMNEMIYCLRFNKMWDFRRKYRTSDILLVDDIQFIARKERTQEEFFHTFNALYEVKKQIIVTSDLFPQDLPDIEERLRNRFQWGLIADIQPPDVEHRVAILMTKAEKQGWRLTDQAAQYIAHHSKGSVRILEGALKRVAAHASLQGRSLDLELATDVLQFALNKPQRQLTVDLIQKIVAEHFNVRLNDLKSKKRQRAISNPRQIAMYLSRIRTSCSFPEIGAKFGGKDHTTVIHAVRKVEIDKKNDLEMRADIESIDHKLDQLC